MYEDYPYWDKQRKQNRHRRVYIGKLGDDGSFIPNKRYLGLKNDSASPPEGRNRRLYCGVTHLLNEIGRMTGIEADLKACFPDGYKKLLSLAYYLVSESDSPLYRFPRWAHDHWHPFGGNIPSQRIGELLGGITESGRLAFFKRQTRRRREREYLAYDTTSVSSMSECIKAVRYGKNKDDEPLPQVNLALVFGEESGMPVYYRVLPGNIQDVSTVKKLLKDVEFPEIKKLKLVMDRGFYSAKNINALYKGRHKFLIAVRAGVNFVSDILKRARESIKSFSNYDEEHDVYSQYNMEEWPYSETDKNGKAVKRGSRRIYVHIYYNGTRAEDEKTRFIKSLRMAETAILAGDCDDERCLALASKYFHVNNTPARGLRVSYREDDIKRHIDGLGYFVLLSNDINDPSAAIEAYRRKDMVEKAFDNLKERLGMRRTTVHSDEALAGKFFLQFLSLMYVSYIHKCMKENSLYQNYTMQTLLDSLDVIERYEREGERYHCGEITERQRELFRAFDANIPNTL
ncbi:MAG: IS1634 family transposase [Synergistaceae bacterium]|nr:IS1634 family transposase [Synergistaceae bacterium]